MDQRPNIVLFLSDDHASWALGCYGNREALSPSLDRLAAEGVRFANAFTPCPVCSPGRACLLTGRTPSQTGLHDWLEEPSLDIGDRDWMAAELTLPELLTAAGYYCGLSGKWHLGRSRFMLRGLPWYFGLPGWEDHHSDYCYIHNNVLTKPLKGYKTDMFTEYAGRFLEQAPSDRPFFLTVGYIGTHSPFEGHPQELVRLYDNAKFDGMGEHPAHPWKHNEGLPQDGPYTREQCVWRWRNYYAGVTGMDRGVQRILDALKRKGALENTLVIYTSDHGINLGQHGVWGKGNGTRPLNMYEESIRVPLLMRWPAGLGSGLTVHECVDHYDTFRLVLEAAHAEPAADELARRAYPGRSYAPLARGQRLADWRETRFGEYGRLRMVRTPSHKLVKRYPSGPDELFDLTADPGEETNLSARPECRELKARLTADLDAFYRRHETPQNSGLRVRLLPRHNTKGEAWRDGWRERLGFI